MSNFELAIWSFPVLLLLVFLRAPIALAMIGVGAAGTYLVIGTPMMTLNQLKTLTYGTFSNYSFSIIPLFLLMGQFATLSGMSASLFRAAESFLGHRRGGVAMSAVGACAGFGAICGSSLATAATMGQVALPELRRYGYPGSLATGALAAGGTLGILIPPSVMLVFMGDILTINLAKLFIAALVPGLVLAAAYMIYIAVSTVLKPDQAPVIPPLSPAEKAGLWREALVSFSLPVLLIVAVLGSIIGGLATPTEAAAVGAFAALLLGLARRRLNRHVLGEAMDGSIRTIAMFFFIFVAATGFAYVFRIIGGEHFIVDITKSLNMGDWGILAMLMLIIFAMGFFFDWIEITLIMLPIVAPIVALMDFGDHVAKSDLIYWFAVLMAVTLQTSFLTPPFGFALFYLKGAAGHLVSMRQIYQGIIPFVLLQVGVLLLLVWQPWIALWLPNAVLK
ncbi:MAG: TRAP transporter large permease subunit [Pseudomonadota bacterium]